MMPRGCDIPGHPGPHGVSRPGIFLQPASSEAFSLPRWLPLPQAIADAVLGALVLSSLLPGRPICNAPPAIAGHSYSWARTTSCLPVR